MADKARFWLALFWKARFYAATGTDLPTDTGETIVVFDQNRDIEVFDPDRCVSVNSFGRNIKVG